MFAQGQQNRVDSILMISRILALYVLLSTWTLLWGVLLDRFDQIGNRNLWMLCLIPGLGLIIPILKELRKRHWARTNGPSDGSSDLRTNAFTWILLINLAVIVFASLVSAFFLPPHNTDAITYHLPRVFHYLQNESLSSYESNYIYQTIHPRYSAILNIAWHSVLPLEAVFQLVQFTAGIIAAVAVTGIARSIGASHVSSIIAGVVFLSCTNVMLQLSTPQNDLLIASYFAACLFFILKWANKPSLLCAILASLSISVAIGIKANVVIFVPSILTLLIILVHRRRIWKNMIHFSVLPVLLFVTVFTSGYWDNYQRYGHPLGPSSVASEVTILNESVPSILLHGSKNLARYSIRSTSADGLPRLRPIVIAGRTIQRTLELPFERLGLDLYNPKLCRKPYTAVGPDSHEDRAWYGVISILILIPSFLLSFLPKHRERYLPISISVLVFYLTQSYLAQYDPWRGRAFISAAVLFSALSPIVTSSFAIGRNRILAVAIAGIILLSSLSAFAWRRNRNVLPYDGLPSVFNMDRVSQITANQPHFEEPLRNMIDAVRNHPECPVWIATHGPFPEYALFSQGAELFPITQEIIRDPLFTNRLTEGLIFFHESLITPASNDLNLSSGYWAREL